MNRTIRLEKIPERIVSLVPSQTELLHDLGLGERVIAITKFCIHPAEWFKSKTRIGGTKNLNLNLIESLRPDLIIGNKEENTQTDFAALSEKFSIYMSDIFSVEDALKMIHDLGVLTKKETESNLIVEQVKRDFETFQKRPERVLYLIWAEPFMAAGENTFIGDVIRKIGWQNCIQNPNSRYPEVSLEEISRLKPDLILLSSEPFPFTQLHADKIAAFHSGKIVFVDGELFSWYGSRMKYMSPYFKALFQRL